MVLRFIKFYVFSFFFCQLLFSLKVTISTEKINANAAKDFERRCRGIPLENAPPDMCHKPNRDADCLRLCKESGPKTGFYFGTCAVKDNKHYCHCYNNICGPPLPPIKGPPPRV